MATSAASISIGPDGTTVDAIVRIAEGAPAVLTPAAVERIVASRSVVDDLVSGEELIYGLNTGLGHMRDVRMPVETLGAYQEAIVASHDGAIGEALEKRVVRAAMAVRVAGIARGGSGASPAIADMLVAMLERGVHPIVPAVGSVGASDLMHMAAIAQVAMGKGRAELGGEVLDGGEALARAGLEPIALQPKDGLAFVSANGVSVGWAALVADRAAAVADLADLVVSMTLDASEGNLSIVDPVAVAAKPVPGQAESARRIRAFLAGSARWTDPPRSVQDPLSVRVAPQVHGAFREFTGVLRGAVESELAAMDDNPLVDLGERRIISNGNFHPIAMALAADALRPAIAHVGQLSDRRMNHLWTLMFERMDVTSPATMLASAELGGPFLRYAAATRAAELRELAGPVTLDIGPLDLGIEDHATNAVTAARRSDEALNRLEDVLAIELVMAWQILRLGPGSVAIGAGTRAAMDALDSCVPAGLRGSAARFHAMVWSCLHDPILKNAMAAADAAT